MHASMLEGATIRYEPDGPGSPHAVGVIVAVACVDQPSATADYAYEFRALVLPEKDARPVQVVLDDRVHIVRDSMATPVRVRKP